MKRDLVVSDWAWVVAVCAPSAAFKAEESLREAGAYPFVLRQREWAKIRNKGVRRREIKESSLFGRYVPVGVKNACEWGWLRAVRNVGGVLKVEDRALIVPARVIGDLVEAEARGDWDFTIKRKEIPVMRAGAGIRVKDGPLYGAEGELVSDAFKDGPAHALFKLLGASRVVKIPVEQLELT